jgi:O-antigen/teichoic acid export membrane protein
VITALLWLAVTPFVLVRLEAERFGIWALFFAFLSYVLAFDLGLQATMMRYVASARGTGDGEGLHRTLRRGLALAFGLGAFWAGVVVLARGWIVNGFHVPVPLVPETLEALLIFAAAVLLIFPAQSMIGSLQGFERFDLSNTCQVSGVAAQIVCLYFGLAAGGGLAAAALAGVIGQGVVVGMAGWMLRMELRGIAVTVGRTPPDWGDLMNFGAALQLAGLLLLLQFQSGKILLGLLGNLPMVSDYELAFRVGNAVGSVPALLMMSVLPTVSRAWQAEERAAVTTIFISTSRWVYATAVMALGLLWLLAHDITLVWLGAGHESVANLMRVWSISYFVILVWGPGTVVARGIGMPWPEVAGMAVSLVVNVTLSLWWIPRFGAAGAVAALGASFVPAFVVFAARFHVRAGIPFRSWFSREFLPRVVAGLVTVALCELLLSSARGAGYLPPPGLRHGAVTVLLFVAVFALLFAPLGDTQRISHVLRQLAAGLRTRRPGAA